MSDSTAVTAGPFLREWLPGGVPRGAFLLFHGMESHSGWYTELASHLVGHGWAVLAGDRTGCGSSWGERGSFTSYRDALEDATQLASRVREKYTSLHVVGMSWGGMGALYFGLRRGWLLDSLAMLAPGLFTKIDFGLLDKLRVAANFLRPDLSRQVEPLFRPEHFTKIPKWQAFIENDPLRLRRVSASFCVETIKMRRFIQETAGKRRLPPALCLLAGDDAMIDNQRTGDLCRRAGAEVETIAGAAHSLIFEKPLETAERLSRHALAAAEKRTRERRRVWVVGGGAVGGTVASLLAFGGQQVGLLVKPSQVGAIIREKGVVLQCGNARRRTGRGMTVAATPGDLPPDPDLVLLAVKSFDTAAALAGLADAVPGRAVIASLQNGLGNEEVIANAFPDNPIAAMAICASLELIRPGEMVLADDHGGLGMACRRGADDAVRDLCQAIMPATGMECRWVAGERAVERLKWSKLMLNIGFNALNSLTGLSSAQVLADDKYGTLAVRAMREGFALMRKLSLEPVDFPGFPVSKLRWVVRLPLRWARRLLAWRAGRAPEVAFSMRQDMLKNRQHTEIDDINGIVVKVGQEYGLTSRANKKLVEMMKNFL